MLRFKNLKYSSIFLYHYSQFASDSIDLTTKEQKEYDELLAMVQTWRFADGRRKTGTKTRETAPIPQCNIEPNNNNVDISESYGGRRTGKARETAPIARSDVEPSDSDVDISESEVSSSDIEDLEYFPASNNNNRPDRLQVYYKMRSLVGAWYKDELVFSSLATQTKTITTLCGSLKKISLTRKERKEFDKFLALLNLSIASHMKFAEYLKFDDAQWKNTGQSALLDDAIEEISKTFNSMRRFALKTNAKEILMSFKIKIGMLQRMIKEFISGVVDLTTETKKVEQLVIRKHLKRDIYAIGQYSYDIIEMSKKKNVEILTEKLRKYFVKMNRQAHLQITTNPIKSLGELIKN